MATLQNHVIWQHRTRQAFIRIQISKQLDSVATPKFGRFNKNDKTVLKSKLSVDRSLRRKKLDAWLTKVNSPWRCSFAIIYFIGRGRIDYSLKKE